MKKFVDIFDEKFRRIHETSCKLIRELPPEKLFWQPIQKDELFPINSCGEYILRSAGKVEQTFGGITRRLWDDPFEWTLPEQLSTHELILEYLDEVEATRIGGFALFKSDADLSKELPAPLKIITLFELLLDTISTAENLQGRASAILRLFSNDKAI